jgi:hypothetical protein
MKQALDLADGFAASAPLEDHWAALATFRQALEPDEAIPEALPEGSRGARVAMTSFLRGLNIKLADRFSISPGADLAEFGILPFSGQQLERAEFKMTMPRKRIPRSGSSFATRFS